MGSIVFKQQQQEVVKPKPQTFTSLSEAKEKSKRQVSTTSSAPDVSGSYMKPKYVEDKTIIYKSSSYLADLIREED